MIGLSKLLCLCACLLCSACATPVQPWQKGALAKTEMNFGSDRMEARFNAHIYSSKEAAAGGASVGGGGCGCN
ncbi:MAG: DUF4266 domain-containing protein [Burkholderiales bacterium]|nr:DUF4266 domain-containing protein [Burkholderiales bacterium]